jgi:hypothetical protein
MNCKEDEKEVVEGVNQNLKILKYLEQNYFISPDKFKLSACSK